MSNFLKNINPNSRCPLREGYCRKIKCIENSQSIKPSPIHPSFYFTNSRARVILRTKDVLCCCHLLIVEQWLIITELVYEPPGRGQLCAPPGAGALCSSQRKVSTVVTNIAMNDSEGDVYQDCSHVSSARIEEGDCTAA